LNIREGVQGVSVNACRRAETLPIGGQAGFAGLRHGLKLPLRNKVISYSMADRVYLDWNATTPLRPEARSAMGAAWDFAGNPSSVHAEGRHARRLIEDARAAVAAAVGGVPRNVVFTSSGTEANALALSPGVHKAGGQPARRLLISAIEHASVLAGGRFTPDAISKIPVTPSGVVDLTGLRASLATGGPALVSIMAANNETGAFNRSVKRLKSSMKQAGCCMSMRFRRLEKYHLISTN
jgi:cysteine desulfurase